jgi:hypothetical protein
MVNQPVAGVVVTVDQPVSGVVVTVFLMITCMVNTTLAPTVMARASKSVHIVVAPGS